MDERDIAKSRSATGLSFANLFEHLRKNQQDEFQDMPRGLIYYISRQEVCLLPYKTRNQDVLSAIEASIDKDKIYEGSLLEFHVFTHKKEYRCLVSSRGSKLGSDTSKDNGTRIIEHFVSDESKGYSEENIDQYSFCDTVLLEKRISKKLGLDTSAYLKVINYFDFDSNNGMLQINDYRLVCNDNGWPFSLNG